VKGTTVTQQPHTTQQDDPFAASQSRPSVSFKNVPPGTTYYLQVDGVPKMVQARDFDSRELEFWSDGNPKMTVATDVIDMQTGEEKCLWAPKPSSMFAAIQGAQQAAGATLQPGGRLVVQFTHEVPVEGKPHLNPAKQYAVTYQPPNPFENAQPVTPPVQQPVAPPVQQAPPAWAVPPVQQPVRLAQPVQQQLPVQTAPAGAQGMLPPLPQQAYPQGAQPLQPVQQAATAPGPTPEAIAALTAAGVDPATVYPGWVG